jgi:acetoacetyl-CoA synthetase
VTEWRPGYLPDIPEAVVGPIGHRHGGRAVGLLRPGYGTDAVVDRLAQIEPSVLIAGDGYRFAGRYVDRRDEVERITSPMPSVGQVVIVPRPPCPLPSNGRSPSPASTADDSSSRDRPR